MEDLPYIDEHATPIDAPPARIWTSLTGLLHHRVTGDEGFARLLGCEPGHRSAGRFDGSLGQTLPGFRVVDVEPERRLVLEGRHRFSHYRLTFLVDGGGLRALTHAAFPGLRGRLYRAAVIGSGAHRVLTRRVLRQVADRA